MNGANAIVIFFGGTILLLLLAITLVSFLIIHKKKRFQHLLEKQQMESNYQNQLLLSKLEVQEQSFKYFSEEIHDNIGQLLSLVKMQLYGIAGSSHEAEIQQKANESTELLGKAINDLRSISHTLNSGYVSRAGLAEAIEKELGYISSAKNIACRLHQQGQGYELPDEEELMVFRIVQEAMGNAIKHALPTAIDVYLDYGTDMLKVAVKDNGSGFEPDKIKSGGIGLNNMHVRAELLKGRLSIESSKEGGTTVLLEIDHSFKTLTNDTNCIS